MAKVTDRDKLTTQIRGTVEFEFGTLIDGVTDALGALGIKPNSTVMNSIAKRIRDAGNNAIRVINNHLDTYNISRKHQITVNASKIAARAIKENAHE